MKKLFLAAALTAACSLSAIADDDAKYKWSTDNCKDAGVTTSVDNRYNQRGNDAQVTVSNRPSNMQTRTTITNEYGDRQEYYNDARNNIESESYDSYYEVKDATTECRWKK